MRMPSCTRRKMKRWHDNLMLRTEFHLRQQVLLYNSRLRLFPSKLKSRWSGPFKIKQVFPFGIMELWDKNSQSFRVNGQQLKHYYGREEHKVENMPLEEPQDSQDYKEPTGQVYLKTLNLALVGRHPNNFCPFFLFCCV